MSCGTRLSELIIRRDSIEAVLGTDQDFIELNVRGKQVKYQVSTQALDYLNLEILKLENIEAARTRGPARNRVRLVK